MQVGAGWGVLIYSDALGSTLAEKASAMAEEAAGFDFDTLDISMFTTDGGTTSEGE